MTAPAASPAPPAQPQISVRDLTLAYGDFLIQRDLTLGGENPPECR